MGTIPPTELLKQWGRGDLTGEQAIGHLAQNMEQLTERLEQYTASLRKMRKDVDSLIAYTEMPPSKR